SVRELLFNAVKHARADRVFLELALDAEDQLSITVTDQGIGFEPASLDNRSKAGQVGWGLFSIRERLTLLGGRLVLSRGPARGAPGRTHAAQVGCGLFGLPDRLTLAGGRLDIESAPGRGARVRLVAPRGAAQAAVTDATEGGPARSGAIPARDEDPRPADALRILIVDDHEAVTRALRKMLHE